MHPKPRFAITIALVFTLAGACSPASDRSSETTSAVAATAPQQPGMAPTDALRPADEVALLRHYADYEAKYDAPNAIVREEIEKKREDDWSQYVAKLGEIRSWTGKMDEIHGTGWFSIKISDQLTLYNSQAMAGSATIDDNGREKPNPDFQPWLFEKIRNFSKGQPVKFTGEVDPELVNVCFERYEYSCEVKITSIDPL